MQSNSGLPLIPLSPIAQSYVISNNALTQACEKLTEARDAHSTISVDIVRRLIENVKVEKHRLDTLTRKMQSLEAATAFQWDPEVLARQIAIIDSQLYSNVIIDKRLLSQLDTTQTKLTHLLDFHKYLTHSFAHQLIYWAELTKGGTSVVDVVPPIHAKDSLITHFIRTAFLLLHAYRDFSGFAAIIKAISLPEVRRLKRLWQSCNSRTKDMYRDLAAIISPTKNYQAYHTCLRSKLEPYVHSSNNNAGMMIAIPWVQPILLSIRSIVTAYTAGDNEGHNTVGADIVLSAPGVHKLDIELAFLELCQQNTTIESSEFLLEELLANNTASDKAKRLSTVKPIHLEGVRAAVIPHPNLNHLAPGDQLTHHWLVSRVYLRKDQLIDESIEVEPLKIGEKVACDEDEFFFGEPQKPVLPINTASRPTSFIIQPSLVTSPGMEHKESSGLLTVKREVKTEDSPSDADITHNPESSINHGPSDTQSSENNSQEHDTSDDEDNHNNDQGGLSAKEPSVVIPNESKKEHEVTPLPTNLDVSQMTIEQKKKEPNTQSSEITVKVDDHPVEENKLDVQEPEQPPQQTSSSSDSDTSSNKHKKKLSPTAPEFIPTTVIHSKVMVAKSNSSVSSEESWRGYPIRDDDSTAAKGEQVEKDGESEKWNGYPIPQMRKDDGEEEEEEEEEVWRGYPGPNSNTDSPRRASSQSETSEEWKGYHATKMEADWQRESALKVKEHEWQGYVLETLNEDELDSSTMMDGEFQKSRQARGQQGKEMLGSYSNGYKKRQVA
ncbi:RasGEF domain-containing protein [Pilobolus umbonatus]|nr:RasGEF domain-containing protein [Pilobolus umbonatus]